MYGLCTLFNVSSIFCSVPYRIIIGAYLLYYSVIITVKNPLNFDIIERANEIDGLEPINCQPWTSRLPKSGQPDLDYTAPEIQTSSTCSLLSDMFSLGMVISAIFNNGKSLINSNHSSSNYLKQIEGVR